MTSNSSDKILCHSSHKPCIKEEGSDESLTDLTMEEPLNFCLCKKHKVFCVSTPPVSRVLIPIYK